MSEETINVQQFKLGALKSKKDLRDYRIAATIPTASLPQEYEIDQRYMPAVKNQGSVGSCVAHAISEAIEYFNNMQGDCAEKTMSVGYIYGNRRNTNYKDSGMFVRFALQNVLDEGDVPYSKFPYNQEVSWIISEFEKQHDSICEYGMQQRISSYVSLNSDAEMKTFLFENNSPIVMAMDWYDSYYYPINGVLDMKGGECCGGHAMLIYGWTEKGWKVQNSWGVNWGNGGRVIVPYGAPIYEAWGITDTITNKDAREERKKVLAEEIRTLSKKIEILKDEVKKSKDIYIEKANKYDIRRNLLKKNDEITEELKKDMEAQKAIYDSCLLELENAKVKYEELTKEYTELGGKVEIVKPFSSKLGDILAKILNVFINLFTRSSKK